MKPDPKQQQRSPGFALANRVFEQARSQLGRALADVLTSSLEALGERLGADRTPLLPDPSKVADQPRHRLRRMLQSDRGFGPRERSLETDSLHARALETEPAREPAAVTLPVAAWPAEPSAPEQIQPEPGMPLEDISAAELGEFEPGSHSEALSAQNTQHETSCDSATIEDLPALDTQHETPVDGTTIEDLRTLEALPETPVDSATIEDLPALEALPETPVDGANAEPARPSADAPSDAAPAPPDEPVTCDEPIRTRSMARLLASQGHHQRALSIYAVLLRANGSDAALQAEAAALRDLPRELPAPE
jgi:hypothetical protein